MLADLHTTCLLLTVMTAVGWGGMTEAGRITRGQIKALTIWHGGKCPPNGTVPNKATVNDTGYGFCTTLLHWATKYDCVDLVRRLLALQANKFAVDCHRDIPLHWATKAGADGAVALLLADGDADRQRMAPGDWEGGWIPLHWAVFWSKSAVVRLLVANCTDSHLHAQLAARGNKGTPLAYFKAVDILKIIAAEVLGRDSCPSNATFISQMLRGQTNDNIKIMKEVIADVSKTTCRTEEDDLMAEVAMLRKRMAQEKQTCDSQIVKLTNSTQVCTAKLNNASCECNVDVLSPEMKVAQEADEAAKFNASVAVSGYMLDRQKKINAEMLQFQSELQAVNRIVAELKNLTLHV